MPLDDIPDHIIRIEVTKVSYKCTTCRGVLHMGEYSEPGRAYTVLSEWLGRHKLGHRFSY